jgi:hypothetical protein
MGDVSMKALVLGALCAGMLAGAAQAQEGGAKADARCVVAMAALYNQPAYKDGATAAMFYYLGRLTGRDAAVDLNAMLRREAQQMGLQDFATEAQRCGGPVREKNEALKMVGEALKARAGR